jgi:hypothetical protein
MSQKGLCRTKTVSLDGTAFSLPVHELVLRLRISNFSVELFQKSKHNHSLERNKSSFFSFFKRNEVNL